MIALEHLGMSFYLTTAVVPVALYFLVLGLLNSRPHPQLLTGRQDMLLLTLILSPLAIVPLIQFGGVLAVSAIVVAALVIAAVLLFLPRHNRSWVIYNLPARAAVEAIEQALENAGIAFSRGQGGLQLPEHQAFLQIHVFPVLRNTSFRIQGADNELSRRVECELAQVLAARSAQTTAMAMGLLLVATAMLVAPLAAIVHRAPEMVRVLTDLLH